MNLPQVLTQQTREAYDWVHKLIDPIPDEHWDHFPEGIESTVAWQVGHLTMSYYYHTLIVVVGHQKDLLGSLPIREYSELYSFSPARASIGKGDPAQLRQHLEIMEKRSLEKMSELDAAAMDQPLEASRVPHPVAKTKFEALDWNIKHTLWHCGQLAMLKRSLGASHNFGIQQQ